MKLTPNQLRYVKSLHNPQKSIFFVSGPAGTGKTALACRHAARLLEKKKIDRLIITKPAVSVDEDHGFLPGDIKDKMKPWLLPIMDAMGENMEKTQVEALIKKDVIEIAPIAYMRGRTFKRSFIIADEMQNSTPNQLKMVMTRIGEGSQIVITGDTSQHDRSLSDNGMADFLGRIADPDQLEYIEHIVLENNDIKRHPAILEILDIYEKF
jgi:phosphate starvation-inducible PhoH-like protein